MTHVACTRDNSDLRSYTGNRNLQEEWLPVDTTAFYLLCSHINHYKLMNQLDFHLKPLLHHRLHRGIMTILLSLIWFYLTFTWLQITDIAFIYNLKCIHDVPVKDVRYYISIPHTLYPSLVQK